ncbi:hypothetical protein EJ08DRAFT_356917 [Tothia fuscella]|uniref:DNA-directed RNA polymerase III subunit RPC9 n=1 Tax=Tothia fuscella TaxID=1048955 RepID=A0A9P4NMQ8_9PEZI|nr:hypothetical protein EJ08DRAFT_356917 [Tothia fuscella]
MQIIDPGRKHITNAEISTHVTSLLAKYTSENRTASGPNFPIPESLTRVLKDVSSALSSQPSTTTSSSSSTPTSILVTTGKLGKELRGFAPKLLSSEICQIVNLRPKDRVELGVIVEELDERMRQDTQDRLLEIVRRGGEGGEVEGDGQGNVNGDVEMNREVNGVNGSEGGK